MRTTRALGVLAIATGLAACGGGDVGGDAESSGTARGAGGAAVTTGAGGAGVTTTGAGGAATTTTSTGGGTTTSSSTSSTSTTSSSSSSSTSTTGTSDPCATEPHGAAELMAERAGYGAGTKGGDPGHVVHVTNTKDTGAGSLREALEDGASSWIVFDVDGVIKLKSGKIKVASNKTVDGRGHDVTIDGTLDLRDVRDVIFTDLRLMNDLEDACTQAGDVVSVRGTAGKTPDDYTTRDIWLHHCDLHDGGDGLFDLRGASKVTVSWNHFHHHKKAILAWKDQNQDPTPEMRVTFHHNFFDRITLRGPQFIYGRGHFVNNYQFEWYEYGASSLGGAQVLSEGNIYEAIPGILYKSGDPNPCGDDDSWHPIRKEGFVVDWDTNGKGYAKSVGDWKINDAIVQENEPGKVFDPHADYAFTADAADDTLRQRIRAEAGPRTQYCH